MNKKFLSAILFGALMVTSTGTFVSCKDYDDDIDSINKELTDIKSQIASLQNQVSSGNYVTGVTKAANGITFAFSNGSPVTIEIKDGAQGVAGKDGSIVEVKEGVLYIDGEATEIKVCETPVIEEGEFLPCVAIVEGEWAVLQEDGTYLSTGYAASSVAVAENEKGGYTLTIKNAEGEETEIELPATKIITDLKATSIVDGKMGAASATLYYGKKIVKEEYKDGLKFNDKVYAVGEYLLSQTAKLSAIVNPLDADATKYAYKLVDTKGNAPLVVSGIKQNMSEKALSRAEATANQGVWDMTLSFADATKISADGVYALTAETVNGVVASPYDVTIKTEQVTGQLSFNWGLLNAAEVKYNTEFDLSTLLAKEEWKDKVVDYYFEIVDKASAESKGIVLNGDVVKSTKNITKLSSYDVKVNVLFVTGQTHTFAVTIKLVQDAPVAQLADVEWTITDKTSKGENVVYLSLASIQSQLIGNSDSYIPSITRLTSTWADGTELNKKSVIVNDTYYGAAVEGKTVTPFDAAWITAVDGGLYNLNADATAYVNAASVQKTLYAKFTFDYTTAFPGEYIVNVGFKNSNTPSGEYAVVVPVKVVVKAPEVNPFARLSAYFNGDEATAYGKVVNGKVQYNLFDLFKAIDATTKTNVVFAETKHDIEKHTCASWFVTGGAKGDIEVGVYNNTTDADNKDNVYSTRAMKAVYTVFGNAHIAKVVDSFNLTVKSEIFEGTLEATEAASVSGQVKDVMKVSMKNITAKDVYGAVYYLGNTYFYNATTKAYDKKDADTRIAPNGVKLVLVDDNAKEYLAAPAAMKEDAEGYPYFEVESASKTTALQSDVTCKLRLEVTDVWGKIKTTDVTVTLKK